jgi:hypothetical protein
MEGLRIRVQTQFGRDRAAAAHSAPSVESGDGRAQVAIWVVRAVRVVMHQRVEVRELRAPPPASYDMEIVYR